jgi:hypothetical protein
MELAAFKEKAKSVMRTFDINIKDTTVEETSRTWLSKYSINLAIRNVGAAFPLTLNQDIQVGKRDAGVIRAFLFSIKSLDFDTQRDEGGQAVMKGFSFQFVPRWVNIYP